MIEHGTRSATNQSALLPLVSRGAFATIIPALMGLGRWDVHCFGHNIKRNKSYSLKQETLVLKEGRKREQEAFNDTLHVSLTGLER